MLLTAGSMNCQAEGSQYDYATVKLSKAMLNKNKGTSRSDKTYSKGKLGI